MGILTRELLEQLENDLLTAHDDGVMAGMEEMEKDYKKKVEELKKQWQIVINTENKFLLAIEDPNDINAPLSVGSRARLYSYEKCLADLEGLLAKEGR
jgi:hypothetical protein